VGSREKPASLLEGALGGQRGLDIRLTETTEAARRRPLQYSAERGSVLIHAQFFLQVMDVHAALAEAFVAHQSRCSGALVLMPSTINSSSALRMRPMASSRFAPKVISLPISES